MDVYQEILADALKSELIQNKLHIDYEKIVEMKCYQAIERIKEVIADDRLDDAECFMKIEEIIVALENIGCHCGWRHDFG